MYHQDNAIKNAEAFICYAVIFFFHTLFDSEEVEPLRTEERSSGSDSSDSEEGEMTDRVSSECTAGMNTFLSGEFLPLAVSGQ